MSLDYQASIDLPDLAKMMLSSIREKRIKDESVSPVFVVVPNLNMRDWLRLYLPQLETNNHLTFGLKYYFLNSFLEEVEYIDDSTANEIRTLTGAQIQLEILRHLLIQGEKEKIQYIKDILSDFRLTYSLSKTLQFYFREYEFNRLPWIKTWAKEIGCKQLESLDDLEKEFDCEWKFDKEPLAKWQKEIYQKIFLNNSIQISEVLDLSRTKPKKLEKPIGLHLFCLANLSPVLIHSLEKMSDSGYEVHIYHFHTGSTKLNHNSGLVSWSKSHCYFASLFSKYKTSTFHTIPKFQNNALGDLKSILIDQRKEKSSQGDMSIRFWKASSKYREMECIANDILYKIQSDSNLTYRDFCILVVNPRDYLTAVQWAFRGGIIAEIQSHDDEILESKSIQISIPYNLTNLTAKESSTTYNLLKNFFTCSHPDGFSRESFLNLVQNDLFFSNSFPDLDFIEIIEKLKSIYEPKDTTDNHFSFSYGISKLLKSLVLSESRAELFGLAETIPIDEENGFFQYLDFWENFESKLIRFKTILQSNLWDDSFFSSVNTLIRELFLFDASNDSEGEESRLLHGFLTTIQGYSNFNWQEFHLKQDNLALFELILEDFFSDKSRDLGSYLKDGVTITSLLPLRPLPIKHMYIVGLGEGLFPGRIDSSPLNLRNLEPMPWDLIKRENQEAMLWENLLSIQDSVTFSFVGFDIKKDKEFEPSSSLQLIRSYFPEIKYRNPKNQLVDYLELPLLTHSDRYNLKQEEMKLGLVSYDLSIHARIDKDFTNQNFSTFHISETKNKLKIKRNDLKDFISFLKDPFSFQKKFHQNIKKSYQDNLPEEIFVLDKLTIFNIKNALEVQIINEKLNGNSKDWSCKNISNFLEDIISKKKVNSQFPLGSFDLLAHNQLARDLRLHSLDFKNFLSSLDLEDNVQFYERLTFGSQGYQDSKTKVIPELQIDNDYNISIFGEINKVFQQSQRLIWIHTNSLRTIEKNENKFNKNSKPVFDNYIDLFGYCLLMQSLQLKFLIPKFKKIKISEENFILNAEQSTAILLKIYESIQSQIYFRINSKVFEKFCLFLKSERELQINSLNEDHWNEFLNGSDFESESHDWNFLKSFYIPLFQFYKLINIK